MNFLDDESVSDAESNASLHQLTINEHYAKAFAYKKEREELSKLKEKYGSDYEGGDDDDESDSETEDEDGEELTPAVDAAILRTLSRIRTQDPAIYDSQQSVFEEEAKRTAASAPWGFKAPKDKSKPLTIQRQNMESLLQGTRSPSPGPSQPTHVQEQAALRDETISAFHQAVSDDGDDDEEFDGGLLTLREKSKDELERQEEEYRAYLEREVGDVKSLVQIPDEVLPSSTSQPVVDIRPAEADRPRKKKTKKGKPVKQETDQEFLMNYILNRGWIDRESRHLPTYSEVTGLASGSIAPAKPSKKPALDADVAGPSGGVSKEIAEDGAEVPDIDELEEFDEVADVFESTYNFRFEEPGAAVIQGHPRQIDSTVRREDTTRKDARERKKARKAEEMAKKSEEVKRLKALKMREIRKKLNLVSKESGLAEDELEALDLDGEWDPSKHDAQMAAMYEADPEAEEEDVDGKPVWNDDIDISDILPASSSEKKSKKQKKKEERRKAKAAALAAENGDGVDIEAMDAEAAPVASTSYAVEDDEDWDGTEEMRKQKLDEYMNELYGMDFNDIIGGDLPTRFKYAPVDRSDFHLSAAEILMATDAELNEYMSLKKIAPYRKTKNKNEWDSKRAERLKAFKDNVRTRTWGPGSGSGSGSGVQANGGEDEGPKKKRKGKKERERAKLADSESATPAADAAAINASGKRSREADSTNGHDNADAPKSKRKRSKHVVEGADGS